MNFYGMKKSNGFYVKEYGDKTRLLIPQEDVVSISLFILQGAKNGAVHKPKKK
jgi:hypothetical protein